MKKCLTLSICWMFIVTAMAQNPDTALVRKRVDSLLNVSRDLTSQRKFKEAEEIEGLAEKEALSVLGKAHFIYGRCLATKGRNFSVQNRYEPAIPFLEQAKDIRKEALGTEDLEYTIYGFNLAVSYREVGRFQEAEKLLLEIELIQKALVGAEHRLYLNTLNSLARLYAAIENFELAETKLLEVKNARERIFGKESQEYTQSLNALAVLYEQTGRLDASHQMILESIPLLEKTKGKENIDYAMAISNLGYINMTLGYYDLGEKYCLKAKSILESISAKSYHGYAQVLDNLGLIYFDTGQLELAGQFMRQAADLREQLFGKNHLSTANSLSNLGMLYMDSGRFEEAEQVIKQGLEIKKTILGETNLEYAKAFNNLAVLYSSTGRKSEAEQTYRTCFQVYEKGDNIENPMYFMAMNGLANLFTDKGAYTEAEKLHLQNLISREKVLGKNHPQYAQSLNNLGETYLFMGRYAEARELFLSALEIITKASSKNNDSGASTLGMIADSYFYEGNYSAAAPYLLESNERIKNHQRKGALHLSAKELQQFTRVYKDGLDILNNYAQVAGNVIPAFRDASYDNILFYKGFLLNVQAQINKIAASDSTSAAMTDVLKSYYKRLAKAYAQDFVDFKAVEELEAKANAYEKELVKKVAGYGEVFRQVGWQDIQKKLQQNEAAIEFVHYVYKKPQAPDSVMYAALVIRPGDEHPHFIKLFEERQLKQLFSASKSKQELIPTVYRRGITPSGGANNTPALYPLIWKPLDSILNQVQRVYLSPSGLLHRLNLAAIPYGNKQTLADRYDLVLLGSTRALLANDQPGSKFIHRDAILYGGINYDKASSEVDSLITAEGRGIKTELSFKYLNRNSPQREKSWPFLPGTQKEVAQIGSLLRQAEYNTQVFTASDASETKLKALANQAQSPRILHIATHGFFFPDPKDTTSRQQHVDPEQAPKFKLSNSPLIRSGLVLAGGNQAWLGKDTSQVAGGEDGILTAYEISLMDLSSTELVVLSACETGLGDIAGNEGVYGLQRALKIAGAKNIIMSLWQVPDAPTQELMTEFYRQWLKGDQSLRSAFYGAQKKMRLRYKDPYLWAGFVLVE